MTMNARNQTARGETLQSCAASAYGLWVTRVQAASRQVIQNNAQAVHRRETPLFGMQVAASRGLFGLSPRVMPSINYYQGYKR